MSRSSNTTKNRKRIHNYHYSYWYPDEYGLCFLTADELIDTIYRSYMSSTSIISFEKQINMPFIVFNHYLPIINLLGHNYEILYTWG
jgi:hypothetical protein